MMTRRKSLSWLRSRSHSCRTNLNSEFFFTSSFLIQLSILIHGRLFICNVRIPCFIEEINTASCAVVQQNVLFKCQSVPVVEHPKKNECEGRETNKTGPNLSIGHLVGRF